MIYCTCMSLYFVKFQLEFHIVLLFMVIKDYCFCYVMITVLYIYVKIHIFKSIIIVLEFIVVEIYILFDKIQIESLIFNRTFSIVMKF